MKTSPELAELVAGIVGFTGKLVFDTNKPDGTMRKVMDVSRINAFGWPRKTSLREGIALLIPGYAEKALSYRKI